MNIRFLTAIIAFVAADAWAAALDRDAALLKMQEDGAECISGVADDTGFWVMAVGESQIVSGKSEKTALDIASSNARNNIAKSFSTQVQSAEESYYSETQSAITESFKKWCRTDTNVLLGGVQVIKRYVEGGKAISVALLTQNQADASAKLQEAIKGRPRTVEATGQGRTLNDAVEMAKRNALEQVNGVTVEGSDQTVDDEIGRTRVYSHVSGFVKAFRIASQGEEGGQITVRIVAEVAEQGGLEENYGAKLASIGDAVFYIVGANDDAVKKMSDFFIGKGLKTTTHQGTADYKIELRTTFSPVENPIDGGKGTQLQMAVVCYDKAGVQLFSLENDPRKAATYYGTPIRQAQKCVTMAVNQMSKPLHQRLQKALDDIVNNGRMVRIVIRNVREKSQSAFVERLVTESNDMPGASNASSTMKETEGTATIRLTLKGNPQDFVDMLRHRVPELPPALEVSPNKIVFEF